MKLEAFQAGTLRARYKYKSFEPVPVNLEWESRDTYHLLTTGPLDRITREMRERWGQKVVRVPAFHDRKQSGLDRASLHLALLAMTNKLGYALAVGVVYVLLQWLSGPRESGDAYHLLMTNPLGRTNREMWNVGDEKS
jgi:hypothetical protein